MDSRGTLIPAGRHRPARPGIRTSFAFGTLLALAVAGCSHAAAPPHSSPSSATGAVVAKCGKAKTAANVPVDVEVVAGHATCGTALTIERDYASAIRSGLAPGNGGGGPVKIEGWTCQGFATPIVLQTGKASKCVRDGAEILAILPPTS
jgi:hypothetical protein